MSTRSRINRNRRKRIHAAELRRHEMQVDGVSDLLPSRAEVRQQAQAISREAEEQQWRDTWKDH